MADRSLRRAAVLAVLAGHFVALLAEEWSLGCSGGCRMVNGPLPSLAECSAPPGRWG